MLNVHVNSPGRNLAPVCLQQSKQHAGYTAASPILPRCHSWGIPFWTVSVPLISTLSPLSWICKYVAKGPMQGHAFWEPENTQAGATPLALRAGHPGELLEDGSSGWKVNFTFYNSSVTAKFCLQCIKVALPYCSSIHLQHNSFPFFSKILYNQPNNNYKTLLCTISYWKERAVNPF